MDFNRRNTVALCIYRALYNSKDFEQDFSMEFPEILAILKTGNCGRITDEQFDMMWDYYNKWRDEFYLV